MRFKKSNCRKKMVFSQPDVLQLALSGVEPAPSHYKYKQTFKLNNCAIEDFPQAQPLMQTAVVYSVVFSRTEKNQHNVYPQRLVFGFKYHTKFSVENCL